MLGLNEKIEWLQLSLTYFLPELILIGGFLTLLLVSLFQKNDTTSKTTDYIAFAFFTSSFTLSILDWNSTETTIRLFGGMLTRSTYTASLKILFDLGGMLTVLLSWNTIQTKKAEYYSLITCAIVGAHLLVMSTNLLMAFFSIELISLPSYVLAAFAFTKRSMEGALKYFLFGSVASAIMLYGMSMLYGVTQTLDYTSVEFAREIYRNQSYFLVVSVCFVLAGFLFKIVAAPLHPWAPDVYEASPTPIVAFFSVVPKLAGIGVLTQFLLALQINGNSSIKWYVIICMVTILSITIGNFAALLQKNPKRMMAYSSISQAGFLLIGIISLNDLGIQSMLFYATVFLLANYLIFYYLDFFEKQSIREIEAFAAIGKSQPTASIYLLIGLLSLTGLPPTAGFMAKVFVFSSLWNSYNLSGSGLYLAVLIIGLLNTVVSMFFYLKIPFMAFLKTGSSACHMKPSFSVNLLGFLLVIVLLGLFFLPAGLMGWLNRITFVH